MERLRVNVISESSFTVKGHGVHSAYEETIQAIAEMEDVQLTSGLRGFGRSTVLHVHTMGPVALARIFLHRGSTVVSAHVTPLTIVGSIRGAQWLLRLLRPYMRIFYNRAGRIISVSEATAQELIALGVRTRIDVSHIAINGNPIRALLPDRARIRRELGWDDDRLTVLAVGQIQPRKGFEEFLECALRLPEARFIWVGGMPFGVLSHSRQELLAAQRDVPENVELTGQIPREAVFGYYAAADVFFLPSTHETFGIATLEAAVAGLPIVVGDLACYEEWLDDAYLSGRGVDDYVDALRALESSEFRDKMGRRAATVASKHDFAALKGELRTAYWEAAGRQP
ncbi:glycosyltransferase family 4 protein [Nonomuraea sp. NPDC050404]|uniref:glycosyltransferase family 4 protein n=1 Tax=Nonomuraea sp. NPDC050404 TaxID=3155783 RepID=UPI0033D479D1